MYDVVISASARATRENLEKSEYRKILKDYLRHLRVDPTPLNAIKIDTEDGNYYRLQLGRVTVGYEVDQAMGTVIIWCFLLDGPPDILEVIKGLRRFRRGSAP